MANVGRRLGGTVPGITAFAAHALVLEALSGIALQRSGREARPQIDGRSVHESRM